MGAKQFVFYQQQNIGQRFGASKMHLGPSVAKAAGRSKVVVLLLWIYCSMYFSLFARVLRLFCYALHNAHSR